MKSPDPSFAERAKLCSRANDRIDEAVKTGKKHGSHPFEIDLLDKVMRPFSLALIRERYRPDSDPNETREIVAQFAANFVSEMINNIAEKDDPEEAVKQARIMLTMFADDLAMCLQVNYGLTPDQARGRVDGAPNRS